jgi:hypothetical protein
MFVQPMLPKVSMSAKPHILTEYIMNIFWIVISWIAVVVYPRETQPAFEQNIPISSSAAPFRLYWPGPKI